MDGQVQPLRVAYVAVERELAISRLRQMDVRAMSLEPNRWYWYDRKKREVIELMAEGYVPAKEQRAGLSADAVAVLTDKNGEIIPAPEYGAPA